MTLVKVKLLEKISPYEKGQEIEMREDLALGDFSEKVEILEKKKNVKKTANKAILDNNNTKKTDNPGDEDEKKDDSKTDDKKLDDNKAGDVTGN